jgi:hypothetical protein
MKRRLSLVAIAVAAAMLAGCATKEEAVATNDLGGRYGFGFAAFDNAQVPHAVHYEPLFLQFAR